MEVIHTKNLSKHFKETRALDDISLSIQAGQIVGLLGPNGAGKSTLIKTLVGGSKPTSGGVEVFGKDPLKNKKELARRFGYMPQDACLYEDLSAKENIRFFAKLHVSENQDKEIDELLKLLEMDERANDRVQNFSGGMKTRISLACAMIHKPDILFLDEPTAGLDPPLKRSLWQLFKHLASQGKTLFISTHLMDEALLCDHLIIIQHGALLTEGAPQDIIAKGNVTIKLNIKGRGKAQDSLPSDSKEIARYLQQYGLNEQVEQVDIQKDSLEDITIQLMEGERK